MSDRALLDKTDALLLQGLAAAKAIKRRGTEGPSFAATFKTLGWEPFERQQKAIDAFLQGVFWLVYGGAAGSGKSDLLRNLGVAYCRQYAGVKATLMRRTYKELEGNHLFQVMSLPRSFGEFRKSEGRFSFTNGACLQLGYADDESGLMRWQGQENQLLLIDESTQFPFHWIQFLSTWVRTAQKGVPTAIIMATNPGGIGHAETKRYFVRAAPPEAIFEAIIEKTKLPAVFIPSRVTDNLPLMESDPGYLERLNALPEAKRRALRDGDWDVFEGQFFCEWRSDKHVILPFTVPQHWRKWGGLDWGFAKPLSFGIYTQDSDTSRIFRVRELYQTELRDGEAVERIRAIMGTDQLDVIWADPSMWIRRPEDTGAISTAGKYIAAGLPLQPANNDRVPGWGHVRDFLADGKDGIPMFQVTSNCIHFIETFPSLVYDRHRDEDIDSDGNDHCADECRYALISRRIGETPVTKQAPPYLGIKPSSEVKRWRIAR